LADKNISEFENQKTAVTHLRKFLTKEDVVLVKGSHGIRMDRIVSALEAAE